MEEQEDGEEHVDVVQLQQEVEGQGLHLFQGIQAVMQLTLLGHIRDNPIIFLA
jgi:hypothetical protein